ncbi:nucleotidyltransferase domain-containing protein [Candidatus Omnitrophota bacterium]
MVKKKKIVFSKIPSWANAFLSTKPLIILSNWVLQGMRYMNWRERVYRICTELLVVGFLFFAGLSLVVSIVVAHTLFWLLNGHIFVLLRYIVNISFDQKAFWKYAEQINRRMKKRTYIAACAAFGSISRDTFSVTSDYDVRIIRKQGLLSSVRAFNACAYERLLAFLSGFPIDIYVFDPGDLDEKIDSSENPVIMCDPQGILKKKYGQKARMFSDILTNIGKGTV